MDWLINDALPVLARIFIVWIFPFSFLDKVFNWDNALKQATSGCLPGGAGPLGPGHGGRAADAADDRVRLL